MVLAGFEQAGIKAGGRAGRARQAGSQEDKQACKARLAGRQTTGVLVFLGLYSYTLIRVHAYPLRASFCLAAMGSLSNLLFHLFFSHLAPFLFHIV